LVLLKTHYRKILDFSFNDFKEAKLIAEKFLNFLINLSFVNKKRENNLDIKNIISQSKEKFKEAMDNDLNISLALASVFDLMEEIYKIRELISVKQAEKIKKYIFEIDSVLGFIKPLYRQYQERLDKKVRTKKIQVMISKREKTRKEKDYAKADKIRRDLLKEGIIVEDAPKGPRCRLLKIVK
ncbi:MAG: DALR domain-containing protein, partial [Patescibacteria group bacterium]|nr:DALR domain-containing protein [Patescibacteria group bacterium]